MAKKVEKNSVPQTSKGNKAQVFPFAKMTSEELVARYKANVAEKKRISEENREIIRLYRAVKSQEKAKSTETKIAVLQAQLEKLQK
jgi:phage terminase Nu1 subunit (DNA packaging protein)